MSTKHTPGPWRIGDAGATIFGPPNGNLAPEMIASLMQNARGNKWLIAAAPELLGWLKFAQEHLESYRQYSEAMAFELGRGHVPSSQFSPAYLAAAIEQVINKATEGQQ